MSNTTKLALSLLIVAILLGVVGDVLLRAMPWGINLPLWVAAEVPLLGGLPWQRPQSFAGLPVMRLALVQAGVRAVPLVSPIGMAAPWQ